jgi:hypothetical protein
MNTAQVIPRHPLDHPGSIKVLLGRAASHAIAANSDFHMAAIVRPDCTAPADHGGRLVLHCLPATAEQLDLCYGILRGTHRAVRIKSPTASKP